jgi:hypothetical protein
MLQRWIGVMKYRVETDLVYHINKFLSIIPNEIFDCLDLSLVRKDCRNQRNALGHGKSVTDQPFPGCIFTAYEKVVESTNARPLG